VTRTLVTFLKLAPRFKVLPGSRRTIMMVQSSPEVSRPLSATQSSRATTPGACLSRVTLRPRAYHAPRRISPSTISLVSFQPGALTGLHPSEHHLAEIASISRC